MRINRRYVVSRQMETGINLMRVSTLSIEAESGRSPGGSIADFSNVRERESPLLSTTASQFPARSEAYRRPLLSLRLRHFRARNAGTVDAIVCSRY